MMIYPSLPPLYCASHAPLLYWQQIKIGSFTLLRFYHKPWLKSLIICGTLFVPVFSYADSIQPNCDIRQLSLTPSQKAKLRFMRQEHKRALDKAVQNTQRVDKSRRASINRILSGNNFDESQARNYVESKYEARMQFEVDELKVQHSFFQLLTPAQQQIWLQTCVK